MVFLPDDTVVNRAEVLAEVVVMFDRRRFLSLALAPCVSDSASAVMPAPAPAPAPPWPEDDDPEFWARIRDQFYIRPEEAFFNTGTLGATPRPVLERVIEDMQTLQATITRWDYSPNTPDWISGYSPALPLREKLGSLVNAKGRDIALTQNATMGMNFVANGAELKSGDEVILTNHEHPGGISGWQQRAKRDGVVVKQVLVPTPANDPDQLVKLFEEAITPRTRVLAFPHVISSTAVVMPVKRLTELARAHGCLSVVDGAQALGQISIDLQDMGCAAYFSSPHKWLLAPAGNGMFYLRRDQQDKIWTTLCSSAWDDHEDGMYRFMQYGTGNPSLLAGLDAALDFHFRVGPDKVRKRMRFLSDRLRTGLQGIPRARISSPVHPLLADATVVHRIEGIPSSKLENVLWQEKRIRVRSQGDEIGVRQSCQIYNSEAEIDATLEIVRKLSV
jgi:isopenicillin-N epimerase